MATKAYILIETAVGKSKGVVDLLREIPGMQSVDPVTGPYEIIAIIEAPDLNSVGSVVTTNIHTISGIIRTITCLSLGSRE